MSEPEIARRCPSCGASIRVRAFFCSQCGKTLAEEQADSKGATLDVKTETTAEKMPVTEHQSDRQIMRATKHASKTTGIPGATATENKSQTARGRLNRAKAIARNAVEDDVLHRVEQLRQISSVVIDEASYDPSLRFVLVAAVLFILFLVMLLLSELIT